MIVAGVRACRFRACHTHKFTLCVRVASRYYIFLKGRQSTVIGWEPVVLLLSSSLLWLLLVLLLLLLLSYDILRCPVVWSAHVTYIIPVIPVAGAHPSGRLSAQRERKRIATCSPFEIANFIIIITTTIISKRVHPSWEYNNVFFYFCIANKICTSECLTNFPLYPNEFLFTTTIIYNIVKL